MSTESPDIHLTEVSNVGLTMPIILTVQSLESADPAEATLDSTTSSVVTTTSAEEVESSILTVGSGDRQLNYISHMGGDTLHRVVFVSPEALASGEFIMDGS